MKRVFPGALGVLGKRIRIRSAGSNLNETVERPPNFGSLNRIVSGIADCGGMETIRMNPGDASPIT